VYAGYDNKPGSRKAAMTVRGNANMATLCEELEVPFSRCGSLLVTYDEATLPMLERKLQNGRKNGVPGMRLLTGAEAEAMEPMLRKGVVGAVYAPSTGTVNPWQLGIAAR
jgi:glycerol-3-phosphate dehydrogenase